MGREYVHFVVVFEQQWPVLGSHGGLTLAGVDGMLFQNSLLLFLHFYFL